MEAMQSQDNERLEGGNKTSHVSLEVISDSSKATNHQNDNVPSSSLDTVEFWNKENYRVEVMPRVPAFVRDKYNSDDYDPLVVSFGPYHHGHPRLQFVEELKPKILKSFVDHTRYSEQFLLNEVLKVIDHLRGSYAQGSTDMYDDNLFARMMLQDAVFAMEYIDQKWNTPTYYTFDVYFGRGVSEHVTRDLYVLENQVPFWFLKIIFHIRCGKRYGDILLKNFLNWTSFRSIEVDDEFPEFQHLVQAIRTMVIDGWLRHYKWKAFKIPTHDQNFNKSWFKFPKQVPQFEGSSSRSKLIHSFHSVNELKAKGIRVRRSVTNSLKDVSFRSGFFFSTLQLPAALATVRTRSLCSNIIAYEMCPLNYEKDFTVTAYVSFTKSLIESPKDVKELQDKGVIKNMLGSDEEVAKLYKDIYTFGIDCSKAYRGVLEDVQEHYNSRARTWLADLLYSYFHSPWTAIALLGSILVIALTMAQTYYAVHPKSNN